MKKIFLALYCVFFSCKEQVPEGVKSISTQEFAKVITIENTQVLDVRTPQEYHDGYIDNAININYFDEDFSQQLKALDINKPVAVYCKKGGRSAKASKILKELGFKIIYDLDGGYDSWKSK